METMNQDEVVLRMFQRTEYTNHFTVPPSGTSGGLSLSWKTDTQVDILSSSPNFIDTIITLQQKPMFVSFIYGAPRTENRLDFWNKLTEVGLGRDEEAWLVVGDFNDLLDNSEKVGGPLRWEGSFLAFRSFVSQMGLWDLQHSGNSLSWRGTRYSHFIQSRLDRAMINCKWAELFPSGCCEYLRFEGSDHRPVLVHLNQTQKKKRGLFRFDRSLKEQPEIKELVEEHWTARSYESVLSKICRIRRKLMEWTKLQSRNNKEAILEMQAKLEEALSNANPDPIEIAALSQKLEKAYNEEELYWRQRSRILWLHSGDQNSGFFHAITRERRTINKFSVIEDANGRAMYEEDHIVNTISEYYRDLFSSRQTTSLQVIDEVLFPLITTDMNDALIRIPDKHEIKRAVFSINPDKAPGLDGFSASFYQSFWDIIGDDVTAEVGNFFTSNTLDGRYNETHVRLIPKTRGAKAVADYRPIALCNTHYKIIAKVLTSRLQPVLQAIISSNQSAFVKGRAIPDNVLITHEVLHCLRTSGAKVRCSMAVKTDMSKAYDRIEWSFLERVLFRLGFHPIWISWIMECIRSVSYSFLVNGSAQGKVVPSRGIRQGDPLSPYLFILCTEVLSGLCSRAMQNGNLAGIQVARRCPPVNHLLFADDTMFFTKTSVACCEALKRVLSLYEGASGQCINLGKSAITFSAKTPSEVKTRVKDFLNIHSEGGAGKYLGLPEHFGRKKRDIFINLIDRIRQKSISWSTRYLSSAGKQVLLQAVLAALPTYTMTCFKLPLSVCKQIQSVLTRFWCDAKPEIRKLCWVSWTRLTRPKSVGGLGFREIEQFNDALLAKLAWRMLKEPQSLLTQILMGKYCNNSSFLDCVAPASASHGWRGILAGREVLKKGLGWVVGNGKSIPVWSQPWLQLETP